MDKFVIRNKMTPVEFDGCAVGVKTVDGVPRKKPRTIKTNMRYLHNYLDGRVCACTVGHAEGRGLNLTDLVQKAFAYAVSVQSKVAIALGAIMAEPMPVEKTLKHVRSFDSELQGRSSRSHRLWLRLLAA